ncbi:MAG TPA: ATP synthase subunit I [Candidatus Acidoferrales bacterium]|nr:ATP synthase subunit I [Candidatus Acidoferrales bacterium]
MDEAQYAVIEQRIERVLVALGAAFASAAWIGWGHRAAEAAAIGTALCWLNFRWLRQGAASLIRVGQAQADAEKAHVPPLIHMKFIGRLLLLLVVAYVILAWLRLPAIAFLCGLVAVIPAVVLELVYEVARGENRWNTP